MKNIKTLPKMGKAKMGKAFIDNRHIIESHLNNIGILKMKNINSKKAKVAIGDLVNNLAFTSKAEESPNNDTTETMYWMLRTAENIVELSDDYGIPNIHYESSLEVINNSAFTDTRAVMNERARIRQQEK